MNNEPFFTHFVVGAILLLGLITTGLVLFILVGLWESGFGTFVVVLSLLSGFSWIVHKISNSKAVQKWVSEL